MIKINIGLAIGFIVKTVLDYKKYLSHPEWSAPFKLYVMVNVLCFIVISLVIFLIIKIIKRRKT